MTELLYQLLDTPKAPLIIQQALVILNNENEKRRAFYEWLDDDMKAEFINGEVVVHSPELDRHTEAVMNFCMLLNVFVTKHDLGLVRMEKALVELTRNSYEPDVCFWGSSKAAAIQPDQLYYPAPDLVVEVLSKSTQKHDRETKFIDYAAHGVAEYWLVDPLRQQIEAFTIDADTDEYEAAGTYTLKQAIESKAVQGFAMPVRAVFDKAANMIALQQLMSA
ncbi:Uma2 family endonuclease [Fibrella forsythiae]|uniref:Uma2 family endonuclease n=1 Tax=Fibrella forsythiae TaxID=2817061 RepID=A0ABS3JH91_9BACT|nr:Uma2 family endonuclease [Fibrella forsythiae]MBO0949377.1 Uma2 family endonuclease [Fibrella forsythiae]